MLERVCREGTGMKWRFEGWEVGGGVGVAVADSEVGRRRV